jgi:diguanylate cyclase (GGDEF)-like protein/PAS domain S-box-containing protein
MRFSLATKLNLLTISLILITSLGISFFIIQTERRGFQKELMNHGRTLADLVAKQAEVAVQARDKALLSKITGGLGLNPVIAYVRLFDSRQNLLTEKIFSGGGQSPYRGNRSGPGPEEESSFAPFASQPGHRTLFEVCSPVLKSSAQVILPEFSLEDPARAADKGKVIGRVCLGLSRESLMKRTSSLILSTLIITSLLVLAGIFLTFFLTRRITSPALRLKQAAQEIAEGRFNSFLTVKTSDELYDLALAFNHMVARLKEYQNQVETRTKELTKANLFMQEEIERRAQTENALRKSEERFRSVIETAAEAIITLDQNGRILAWNPAAEIIFGYSGPEALGKSITQIVNEFFDHHYYQDAINRLLIPDQELGAGFTLQAIGNRKDGTEFPVEISLAAWKIKEEVNLTIILRDTTERRRAEEEIRHASTHDPLTGLFNRSFFEEEMKLLSFERGLKLGILLVDIDGLKFVNDSLGPAEGDHLLQGISGILQKTFRPSDLIARIGGDEFAVILKNVDRPKLDAIVLRLKNNLAAFNQALPKGKNPMSVSLGYGVRETMDQSLDQVFKEADTMLLGEKIPKREDVRKSVLKVLKATMLEKDHGTEEHMGRMQVLARRFAHQAGLSPEDQRKVVLATELHDIGKVVIPDEILNKKGPLTPEEFEIIKKHPETGYRIAKATPEIAAVADAILGAHERWDGKGYPQGLKGEEIPLLARLVFILDAFDVMMNDRPYRKALTPEQAKAELRRNAGTQFDPRLVDIFIRDVLEQEELQA